MTFFKFYGERALHIRKFAAFCSTFTKLCEFGLNDVIYTYKCMKNFTPGFPWIQEIFINQIFYPCKWIKIRPTWKKSVSNPTVWKKLTQPRQPQIFFFSKITISLFLKIALFICICSSFHVVTFVFILLHRNFNVTQQIFRLCIILKHTMSWKLLMISKSAKFII